MQHYRICGLDFASELELPGAIASPAPAGETDVTVRRGPIPDDLPEPSTKGPNWTMAGDRFLLRLPGIARFLISAGREIVIETVAGKEEADAVIFLLGSALSIVLHQRGRMVLHASAVSVGGKAVLFCGPSGAGKSTLAAALNERGYPFVNDDVCCIGFAAGRPPVVLPDGRLLKLWEDALDHLKLVDRKGDAVRSQLRKFYVPSQETVKSVQPIAALYALRDERAPFKRGIERPNLVDATQMLRRNAHRPRLVADMGLNASYFASATDLLRSAGIFLLTKPRDFGALPEIISLVEEHWRALGLLDAAA